MHDRRDDIEPARTPAAGLPSPDLLAALVDALPVPVRIVDASRQLLYANAAHQRAFPPVPGPGRCHQAVLGRPTPCPECPLPAVLESGEALRAPWRGPVPGPAYEVLHVPVAAGGAPCQAEVVLDVSDRAQALDQLRHLQRLDQLGTLAAGIAHDFNNLLSSIYGFAQLGQMSDAADPAALEPYGQIRALADRGADLTRKLLAFARRQPVLKVPLDLSDLVRSLVPLLTPLMHEGVRLDLDLAPKPQVVLGDRGLVEQVVFNLCTNAVEAMAEGGTLTLRTRDLTAAERALRLAPEAAPAGPGVALEVEDTGPGMPAEVAARVFEPFFTTKGKGRGTGLGLSVSAGIVRQLGGHLVLRTSEGAGTCLSLVLPSHGPTPTPRPAAPPALPTPPPGLRTGRALVVEDEPGIRELVARLLARMGFRVTQCAGGEEALRTVLDSVEGYALVVSDLVMPGMDGCTLARRLASLRPATAVLLVTGCDDRQMAEMGVTDAMALLRKPFDLDVLRERVDLLLDDPAGAVGAR